MAKAILNRGLASHIEGTRTGHGLKLNRCSQALFGNSKAFIEQVSSQAHIAAANGAFSRDGIGDIQPACIVNVTYSSGGFRIENKLSARFGFQRANRGAIGIENLRFPGGREFHASVFRAGHIYKASAAGEVQAAAAAGVFDSHAGHGAAAGNIAGIFHLQCETGGFTVTAADGGNLSLQLQLALHHQSAAVVAIGQYFFMEGLHPHFRALLQPKDRAGGDGQLGKCDVQSPENRLPIFVHLVFIAVLALLIRCCNAVVGIDDFAIDFLGNLRGNPHVQNAFVGHHQLHTTGNGVLLVQNAGDGAVDHPVALGIRVIEEYGGTAFLIHIRIGQQIQPFPLGQVDPVDEDNAGAGDIHIPVPAEGADEVQPRRADVHIASGENIHRAAVVHKTDRTAVIAPAGFVRRIPTAVVLLTGSQGLIVHADTAGQGGLRAVHAPNQQDIAHGHGFGVLSAEQVEHGFSIFQRIDLVVLAAGLTPQRAEIHRAAGGPIQFGLLPEGGPGDVCRRMGIGPVVQPGVVGHMGAQHAGGGPEGDAAGLAACKVHGIQHAADGQVAAGYAVAALYRPGDRVSGAVLTSAEENRGIADGGHIADGGAVPADHGGAAGHIQLSDSVAAQLHIAAAGEVQRVTLTRAVFIGDHRVGNAAGGTADAAAAENIQCKPVRRIAAGAVLGGDLPCQLQRTGYIQGTGVDEVNGRIAAALPLEAEGLHQQPGAVFQLQAGPGGNGQLRHGEGDIFAAGGLARPGGNPHLQHALIGNDQRNACGNGVLFIQNAVDCLAVDQLVAARVRVPQKHGGAAVGIQVGIGQQLQRAAVADIDAVDEHNAGTGDVHIAVGIQCADPVQPRHIDADAGALAPDGQAIAVIDQTHRGAVIAPATAFIAPAVGHRQMLSVHRKTGVRLVQEADAPNLQDILHRHRFCVFGAEQMEHNFAVLQRVDLVVCTAGLGLQGLEAHRAAGGPVQFCFLPLHRRRRGFGGIGARPVLQSRRCGHMLAPEGGGPQRNLPVRSTVGKALVGDTAADGQIAALNGIAAGYRPGNRVPADRAAAAEADVGAPADGNVPDGNAVLTNDGGAAGDIQLTDAAAAQLHIAVTAGDIQRIRLSRALLIDHHRVGDDAGLTDGSGRVRRIVRSRRGGRKGNSGNAAAIEHIQEEVFLFRIAAEVLGFDFSGQCQRSLHIQGAGVDGINHRGLGQILLEMECIHQKLSALFQLQAGVGGNIQHRRREGSLFGDSDLPVLGGLCHRSGEGGQILLVLRQEAVVGLRFGGHDRSIGSRGGRGSHRCGDPHIQNTAVRHHQCDPLGDGVFFIQHAGHRAVDQLVAAGIGVPQEYGGGAVGIKVRIGQQVKAGALQHVNGVDEYNAGAGDVYIAVGIEGADVIQARHIEVHAGARRVNLHAAAVVDHTDGAAVIAPAGLFLRPPAAFIDCTGSQCLSAHHHTIGGFCRIAGGRGKCTQSTSLRRSRNALVGLGLLILCGIFTGTFYGIFTGAFAGTLAGTFPGAFAGAFDGTLAGTFAGTFAVTFPGAFDGTLAGAFNGAFTGTFPGALAGAFPGTFNGAFDGAFTGTFPGAFDGTLAGSAQRPGIRNGLLIGHLCVGICGNLRRFGVGGHPQRQRQRGSGNQTHKNSFLAFVHNKASFSL